MGKLLSAAVFLAESLGKEFRPGNALEHVAMDLYLENKAKAKKYGISVVDLIDLRISQDGCAGCGSRRKLVVDHDHRTGKFRGLLCMACNSALGLLRDRRSTLRSLERYLKVNEKKSEPERR